MIDLCLEGDKLLEQGTGVVYNKSVKGVRVPKGKLAIFAIANSYRWTYEYRHCVPHLHLGQQRRRPFLTSCVSRARRLRCLKLQISLIAHNIIPDLILRLIKR